MNQRQFDRDGDEGDNFDPEDDPEDGFNWRNNPIRALFDNPRQSSHRSFLKEEDEE